MFRGLRRRYDPQQPLITVAQEDDLHGEDEDPALKDTRPILGEAGEILKSSDEGQARARRPAATHPE